MSKHLLGLPSYKGSEPERSNSPYRKTELPPINDVTRKISDVSSMRSSASSSRKQATRRSTRARAPIAVSEKAAMEYFYGRESRKGKNNHLSPVPAPKTLPWYIATNPWSKECNLQFTYSIAVREALRIALKFPEDGPTAETFFPIQVLGEEERVAPHMFRRMQKRYGVTDVTELSSEQFNFLFELTKEEREEERINSLIAQRMHNQSAFTTQKVPPRSQSRQGSSHGRRNSIRASLPIIERRRSIVRKDSNNTGSFAPTLLKKDSRRSMAPVLPPITDGNVSPASST